MTPRGLQFAVKEKLKVPNERKRRASDDIGLCQPAAKMTTHTEDLTTEICADRVISVHNYCLRNESDKTTKTELTDEEIRELITETDKIKFL